MFVTVNCRNFKNYTKIQLQIIYQTIFYFFYKKIKKILKEYPQKKYCSENNKEKPKKYCKKVKINYKSTHGIVSETFLKKKNDRKKVHVKTWYKSLSKK